MRLLISTGAIVAALTLAPAAQDDTVKSKTQIRADDAQAVSMKGCLKQDAATGTFTLVGSVAAAGDELKTQTKIETDADGGDTSAKTATKATTDDAAAVGTAGATATYTLLPQGVNLSPHVGHLVEVSAIAVKAGHADADVTIKDKTSVDPEGAPGTTERSKTKIEVPKASAGKYTVVALKHLSPTCPAQ